MPLSVHRACAVAVGCLQPSNPPAHNTDLTMLAKATLA